jgi:Uma2 family endonuclease
MSTHTQPLLTVADLELMPDDLNRYELMEGEIFVSPPPGLTHQRALGNLLTILNIYLARNRIGEVFTTPGVTLDQFNSVIPDITYLSHERMEKIASGEHITGAPELMIEFVSPGSKNARRDRVLKRQVYGRHGVQEYWIVDPRKRRIEVYQLREHALELLTTLFETDEITSPLLPGLNIPLIKIFSVMSEKY